MPDLAHKAVCTTKAQNAESLTLRSPLQDFVGRSYFRKFAGFQKLYTINITGVVPPISEDENDLDRPRLEAKVTPARESYQQDPLFKAEVVDQLDPTDWLGGDSNYELYNDLTSARFIRSALFLTDAKEPQARLSETAQRDKLILRSLDRKVKVCALLPCPMLCEM